MDIMRLVLGYARGIYFRISKPTYVTLMGGPGAGKGTVAEKLAPYLGLAHLSTGALMRREVALNTPLGRKIDQIMKSGKLVPDDIVYVLLRKELERPANWRGAVLDGFPRTAAQAKWLSKLAREWGVKLTAAVQLDVPEADIIERLSGRRVCSNTACGATYHVKFNPAKQDGICDKCKSPLTQRTDDKPEVVLARLAEYKAAQAPILKHFQSEGCLVVINATNQSTPAQVLEQVQAAVKARRA